MKTFNILFLFLTALTINTTYSSDRMNALQILQALPSMRDTNLHYAIINQNMTEVTDAIALERCNVNGLNSRGVTPLQLAVWKDNPPIIQALIRSGAQVSNRDIRGKTVLHYGAIYGCFDSILA